MRLFIRFFDVVAAFCFISWMLFYLFEMYDLSAISLVAVIALLSCVLGLRLFAFYKVMRHRLKD